MITFADCLSHISRVFKKLSPSGELVGGRELVGGFLFFLIFALLNLLMLQFNYETWTTLKYGPWTAFHKGFEFSGFDGFTYIVISEWRPLFELYRHPLLSLLIWPLSWVNEQLTDYYHINCAIYVVAEVWTLMSTATWWLLYRLIHRRIGLPVLHSLLLTAFYFSFAYVMMVTFVPDHMIWTQFLLLLTITLADRCRGGMPWWQSLPLFFISSGITLTNGIKVWLIDMAASVQLSEIRSPRMRPSALIPTLFRRSLPYLIPALMLGAAYYIQTETTQVAEHDHQDVMAKRRLELDKSFAQKVHRDSILQAKQHAKQISDNKLFAYTDNSIPRVPLLVHNMYGEGFILHEDSLLQDANKKVAPRPVIIEYRHWWEYAMEAAIVLLFLGGLWAGRRERLLWLVLPMFAFDMFLHIGLRFAATDVYIMTAHWAFIIPLAVGMLIKRLRSGSKAVAAAVVIAIAILTAALWAHNVSLLIQYMVK